MAANNAAKTARATLKTIAETLGLDISTVSRVVNGTDDQAKKAASRKNIELIRTLAKDLNYRPNPYARSLKTQKSRTIGVLVPHLSDIVLALIYEGIDHAARKHGYATSAFSTLDMADRQREFGEIALDHQVEGLIIADARLDNTLFLDDLRESGIPFVLVSRRAKEYCSVTCDDYQGGRLAAEHLYAMGHRDVAILGGQPYSLSAVGRVEGFRNYYLEKGVQLSESLIYRGAFDSSAGRTAGQDLFRCGHTPTAVFAVNDFLAIGFMGAMRDQGLIVGRDMSVIGFNDVPISKEMPVALSSVKSPLHEMGYRSMELLLEVLKGGKPSSELLTPTLMVRDTSCEPRTRT